MNNMMVYHTMVHHFFYQCGKRNNYAHLLILMFLSSCIMNFAHRIPYVSLL